MGMVITVRTPIINPFIQDGAPKIAFSCLEVAEFYGFW
jgi:hypothetical protein